MTHPSNLLPTLFGLKEAKIPRISEKSGKKIGEDTGWSVYALVDDFPIAVVPSKADAEWLLNRLNVVVYHDRAMNSWWMRFTRAWLKFSTSLKSTVLDSDPVEDTWKKTTSTKEGPSSQLTVGSVQNLQLGDAVVVGAPYPTRTVTPASIVDSATAGTIPSSQTAATS